MATLLISYDLVKEGSNYEKKREAVVKEIEGIGTERWHMLTTTWLVVTSETPEQVRNKIGKHLDSNDKLIVLTANAPAAWKGFNDAGSAWLKKVLK